MSWTQGTRDRRVWSDTMGQTWLPVARHRSHRKGRQCASSPNASPVQRTHQATNGGGGLGNGRLHGSKGGAVRCKLDVTHLDIRSCSCRLATRRKGMCMAMAMHGACVHLKLLVHGQLEADDSHGSPREHGQPDSRTTAAATPTTTDAAGWWRWRRLEGLGGKDLRQRRLHRN